MKKLILNKYGNVYPITFEIGKYVTNKNLAIQMITETEYGYEPWSTLTVNLTTKCAENCAFIDTNNNGDEIIDWLINNQLGHLTGKMEVSGWCIYPEFAFNMENLMKYVMEE